MNIRNAACTGSGGLIPPYYIFHNIFSVEVLISGKQFFKSFIVFDSPLALHMGFNLFQVTTEA